MVQVSAALGVPADLWAAGPLTVQRKKGSQLLLTCSRYM